MKRNGEGLLKTLQGAYFRHYCSLLFYGPGSKWGESSCQHPGDEKISHYRSCFNDLSEDKKKLLQLKEAYSILRTCDLLLEKIDYEIRNLFHNTKKEGVYLKQLWDNYQDIRNMISINNYKIYRNCINRNPINVDEIMRKHLFALNMLNKFL